MTWTEKRKAALERMWGEYHDNDRHDEETDDDVLNRILAALTYLDERLTRSPHVR